MLDTAELLRTKLIKHDSQTIAMNCITDQLADVMEKVSYDSLATEPFNADHNGTSKLKASISETVTLSQGAPGTMNDGQTSSAMQQLCGVLGVVSNQDLGQDRLKALCHATIVDQERKVEQRSNDAERSLLSTIEAATKGVSNSQQLIVDALISDATLTGVKMSNADLRSRRESLQTMVETIGSGLPKLDFDKALDNNRKWEAFVDSWKAE